jgi:UDP-N-acetylglucosamine/UDP-N-acetylgalactosamine diphosphorylase
MDEVEIRARVTRQGQQHLLAFWDELTPPQRAELTADLDAIDFELVAELADSAAGADHTGRLSPPKCLPAEPIDSEQQRLYDDARRRGEELISAGKVAALVVAGGQGTRLGFDGPKGAFPASPIKKKPLFQLFAESLLASRERFGAPIRWYVMTSPTNDQTTKDFFAAHGHFGLDGKDVIFFQQGQMPAIGTDGRVLLAEKHRVATSPDGHGGTIRALAVSGALADMAERGIELVSYFQVDNPLVRPVDPLFCGMHDVTGSQMSSLTIGKASDDERVGVFADVDGKLQVVEYSDLPQELATAKNDDGSRTYDAANVAIHVISRAFLEDLTRPGSGLALPWHRAKKAVSHVDPTTGQRITSATPNAIKFETFIFDALPLANNPLLLGAHRSEVFSPIKNADGVDSPETARRHMSQRAAHWLEQCGVKIPRNKNGDPDCTLEISPLAALDADHLRESLTTLPIITAGAEWCTDRS